MNTDQVLLGLKRASWLFALVAGLVTSIIINSDRYSSWDEPDEYLPGTIAACVIAFVVFRITIWVFKGFSSTDASDTSSSQPNKTLESDK